jgi:hypothetical protein
MRLRNSSQHTCCLRFAPRAVETLWSLGTWTRLMATGDQVHASSREFRPQVMNMRSQCLCGVSFPEWELVMEQLIHTAVRIPWNNGKLVGQKAPLKLKDKWAIRVRLQIGRRTCELALFNLAIDSKLRSCHLMRRIATGGIHPDIRSHATPRNCDTCDLVKQCGRISTASEIITAECSDGQGMNRCIAT